MARRAWVRRAQLSREREVRSGSAFQSWDDLVRQHAPGNSFVDVGCMWGVNGGIAYLAEESGATAVTGVDVMEPTPEYEAEHKRRNSKIRFVLGDLHDPNVMKEVGSHDVVWCSGVIYHAPHPLLMIERLAGITGSLLLLGTAALPEVPGVPQAMVFYPGLGDSEREHFDRLIGGGVKEGLGTPFDADKGFRNWFWGITPSALRGMLLASGFTDVEIHVHTVFHITAVARRSVPDPHHARPAGVRG